MSSIARYLKQNRRRHLYVLKQLLAIPSISTDPAHAGDVARAAAWVRDRLEAAGCSKSEIVSTKRHPIVYGEWLGAPGRPTMLVYGHYDVQPVDPIELWQTPPFEPRERGGKLFARGASDDKGQVITHVNALEAQLRNGSAPINVKFLIEGEEEIGSPSLHGFVARNRKKLRCDAVVVSDTAMLGPDLPSICYGLRGLTYLELRVRGSTRDLHSGSFGGSVINPANALARMLSALKDSRGRVAVPGFYENVRRITPAERRRLAALPHSDRKFCRSFGAPRLFGEAGYSTLERIWCRPTLDINGIWGGFTGEGAKTVIPAEAGAKISMRLVPDQTDREIAAKVKRQLEKIAPRSVEVSVRTLHGGDPWITSPDQPALRAAGRALERAFGRPASLVREGGSIPIIATFDSVLQAPALLLGFGLHDDNLHAPNEKMELANFYRGIESSAYLMEELGRIDAAAPSRPRRPRTRGSRR